MVVNNKMPSSETHPVIIVARSHHNTVLYSIYFHSTTAGWPPAPTDDKVEARGVLSVSLSSGGDVKKYNVWRFVITQQTAIVTAIQQDSQKPRRDGRVVIKNEFRRWTENHSRPFLCWKFHELLWVVVVSAHYSLCCPKAQEGTWKGMICGLWRLWQKEEKMRTGRAVLADFLVCLVLSCKLPLLLLHWMMLLRDVFIVLRLVLVEEYGQKTHGRISGILA